MSTKEKLETAVACSAVWEAEIIRDRLESAGILAFVQGAETGRSLSYVGVALGGIKVQVPASQLEEARELLAADALGAATQSPWTCPRCGEPNDAAFDVCYSCSMPRPASDSEPVADDGSGPSQPPIQPSFQHATIDPKNPYAATTTSKLSDPFSEFADETAENSLRKAVVAIVFGCIFPVPPFFLLSIALAMRAWLQGGHQIPRLRFRIGLILLLNVIALFGSTFLVWYCISP